MNPPKWELCQACDDIYNGKLPDDGNYIEKDSPVLPATVGTPT